MEINIIEELPTGVYLKFRPNQLDIVRKVWNMDARGIKESLHILKDWVKKQDYFNKKDYPDSYLEKFLVITKGSVERAKSIFERHCMLKTIWPQYYTYIDVNSFRNDFIFYNSVLLPDVTEDGVRVNISRFNEGLKLTSDLLIRFTKFVVITSEYSMANDYPNGFLVIVDHRYINVMELLAFATRHFTLLQQCIAILLNACLISSIMSLYTNRQTKSYEQEGYGMRIKGIHIVTPSKAADNLVTFFKQLLSKKIGERLQVHKDTATLYNYVPKKILPADLGGDAPLLVEIQKDFLKALATKEHEDWLKEARLSTVDESRKPKDDFSDDLIGISGSFRTLSLD